jgi:hypothetical protein
MIICCGSKKYSNIDLSKIVDSFAVIVRHNMLINTTIYGKKESTFQVLNSHIYTQYKNNASKEQWVNKYLKFGIQKERIEEFYDYINQNKKTKFLFYQGNNHGTLNHILHQTKCKHRLNKMPRCGLAYVADSIMQKNKPFLIGYSLDADENKKHQQNTIEPSIVHHQPDIEPKIIAHLHNNGIIDATLCCVNDTQNISLNSKIKHTTESISILETIYEHIEYH